METFTRKQITQVLDKIANEHFNNENSGFTEALSSFQDEVFEYFKPTNEIEKPKEG